MTAMKTAIKTSIGRPRKHSGSSFILIALALGLFALAQTAQPVTRPPDGGYPGQNTAEGQNGLSHLAGGTYNTANGAGALANNNTGTFNTAKGVQALRDNTTGGRNPAFGKSALTSNTVGVENNALGVEALSRNTTGFDNTAIGDEALRFNTTGSDSTAIGSYALNNNIVDGNTAVGAGALEANTGALLRKTGLTSNQRFSPHFAKEFCSRACSQVVTSRRNTSHD